MHGPVVAEETVRVAQDTRRAFYRAVSSRERVVFLAQSQSSAEAATKLMQRLGETGAINKLDQAREQSFYADITAQLAAARQHAASERERLTRLMGFWGTDLDFKLPDALPPLPARPKSLPSVETEAVARVAVGPVVGGDHRRAGGGASVDLLDQLPQLGRGVQTGDQDGGGPRLVVAGRQGPVGRHRAHQQAQRDDEGEDDR